MDPSFWHERWESGRTGFHLARTNPWLEAYADRLGEPGRILVPLCGKSLDLAWLAAHGWQVTGVELSPIAARACFEDAGLTPARRPHGAFTAWEAEGLTVLEGDALLLEDDGFDAVWDRAATIALPPDLRARYAARLAGRVRPGGRMLLVTLDYPQEEQPGPPFSVPEGEVERLYDGAFERLRLGAVVGAEGGRPDWRVSRIEEQGWLLTRRSGG